METDIRSASKTPFSNTSILNPKANGISESAQTAVTDKSGNVVLGGDIIKPKQKTVTDTYASFFKSVDQAVATQAPQVSVSNGKISISAPQAFFDSPVSAQLKNELQVLKGANLDNAEVRNALNRLNEEIRKSYSESLVQQATGWTPEEYNDYQYALQTVSGSNPMKSSNTLVWAKDGEIVKGEDGKPLKQTPKQWVDYWRKTMSTKERADYFKKSLESNNPYERTMALILGQGGTEAVYGFDPWEQAGQGAAAMWNQLKKFPEGTFRLLAENHYAKRVEQLGEKLNIPREALENPRIINEQQFEEMKDNIRGKSWNQLTDDEKAFVVEIGVFQEPLTSSGRKARKKIPELASIASKDDEASRQMIENILDGGSDKGLYAVKSMFDRYKEINNSYAVWQGYGDETGKLEKELAESALWSRTSQTLGNIAGTIGRFLWEDAVVRGLTGGLSGGKGFSMNRISDKLGNGIVSALAKKGVSPASNIGKGFMQFAANLAGTIPEDIIQSAVDNVLTYNSEENANLLNLSEMSDSLKRNLITMAIFNMVKSGWSSFRTVRAAEKMAKQADLDMPIEDILADADDLARAIDEGQVPDTSGEKATIIDEDGTAKVLDNITPEDADMMRASMEEATSMKATDADIEGEGTIKTEEPVETGLKTPDANVDDSVKASDENVDTVKVEVDTPDGKIVAEAPDYRPRNRTEAIELEVEPTPASVKHAHDVQMKVVMSELPVRLQEFHDKFGDVQVSDFDWVWYNTKKGLSPEQIVGTTDPTTGRTVTQNMVDAMKWWGEQPFTKELRMASRGALGLEGDFNTLGYLPHTVYDPSNMSLEEALTGRLWETASGDSVLGDDGKYKGFGGSFEDRYKTFASNMLWDAKGDAVAAAKLIEEAQMDGRELTPELVEQSKRAVEGEKLIRQKVNEASSTKELTEALSSDSDDIDWEKIDENIKEQAPKSGLGQAYHDNYQDVYMNANVDAVNSQLKVLGSSFDQQSDSMKKIIIGNGKSMYDWGGADIVYAHQNAIELVNRYLTEGGDLREMLVEYIENHSHRSAKYAEAVADKWIARLSDDTGALTKGKAIYSLGNSMKWEAVTRLKKWLVTANYSQFNSTTKSFIDRFLFNHVQMESVKNNVKIRDKLAKGLDAITGLRYRALFYGNIKNALLQVSELNRLFTTFKWGDVAKMIKRLATDSNFRARVDVYVDAVAPRTSRLDAELLEKYGDVAESAKVGKDGITFKDLGEKAKSTADVIGLGPINAAEALKNRTMVAALVQEADSLGLTGDEALRHIRNRFERVALAANEMGRIGLASNKLAKPMLFLQNFQIRELGMHYYNIVDATGMAKSTPKKILNVFKYLTKVLGTKLATTLLLTRLGYSSSQALGLDPFGLLENYNKMDEEDMEWIDKQISGGVLTPFFSGGMTSLIADLYFMCRKAYEESTQQTVSDEAEQKLESSWGLALPDGMLSLDSLVGGAENFIPGSTFAKRLSQMNEMMNSGWAVSSTGNKMYTAPDDVLNTVLGYLFGRSATANAQQYNQTYGDNLLQTLGRFNPLRRYNEFDPIDTKNYTDWFKGDANDLQQFNKGLRYFREQRDNIIDTYEETVRKSYASSDEKAEAKNDMGIKLEELYDRLEKFVEAYEKKNGSITPSMVKQVVNVLNTGREVMEDTQEEANARGLQSYSDALRRYSDLGLPAIGTYSGSTESEPSKDTKYQGSPQFRTAVSGYYDVGDEAAATLKLADETLKPLREAIKQRLSDAYAVSDWGTVGAIQQEYLKSFDQVVAPIIALYGNGVLTNTNVANQLRDMLSTGTNKRSGNLIPSSQYTKNKYGKYQSMPYESVDVGDWAAQRYRSDVYKNPTSRSYSTAEEDLSAIKQLISQGKTARARARALQLKTRVDAQVRALSRKDYDWLNKFLKQGGK